MFLLPLLSEFLKLSQLSHWYPNISIFHNLSELSQSFVHNVICQKHLTLACWVLSHRDEVVWSWQLRWYGGKREESGRWLCCQIREDGKEEKGSRRWKPRSSKRNLEITPSLVSRSAEICRLRIWVTGSQQHEPRTCTLCLVWTWTEGLKSEVWHRIRNADCYYQSAYRVPLPCPVTLKVGHHSFNNKTKPPVITCLGCK